MPSPREQVGNVSQYLDGQPKLRPAAGPVDTFAQPNAGNGLSQLAAGLSTIAPSLSRFSDDLAQRDEQQQLDAGREKARAMGMQAKELAKAVKDGKIPEAANPWFRAGLQEQLGRVAADQFGSQLSVALDTDPALKDSTNMADFEKFAATQRQQFLKETLGDTQSDRFFDTGFGSMSDSWIHNARQQFASDVAQRISKQSDDALAARTYATVAQARHDNVSDEQMGADLTKMLDDQYGLNPAGGMRAQKSVVEGIVRLAKAQGDSSILDIIKHVKTGVTDKKGDRLGLDTTGYGAEALDKVTQEIGMKKAQEWELADRTRKHNAEPVIQDFVSQFTQSQDPASFDTEAFEKSAGKFDPSAVETIRSFKRDWVAERYTGNPDVEAGWYSRVFTKGDVSMKQLADSFQTHEISHSTFLTLANEIQQQQAAARSGQARGLLGDPDLEKMQTRIRQLFVPENGESTQEQRTRAESAVDKATMEYVKQKNAGNLKNSSEVETFVHGQSYSLLLSEMDKIDRSQALGVPSVAAFQKRLEAAAKENIPTGALPDWKKTLVVPRERTSTLSSEYEAWTSGRLTTLSDATKQLLFANKVPPDRKSIKEFIDSQKSLSNRQ